MHKHLIKEAFKKAEELRNKKGEKKPSLISMAEDISEFVKKSEDYSIGERSLRDYYNDAKKIIVIDEDISIKQLKVINGLSKFLGHENYEDFTSGRKKKKSDDDVFVIIPDGKDENGNTLLMFFGRKKNIIALSVIVIISYILIHSFNEQRWMVWQENQYIEVSLDVDKYDINQLKFYKKERIENFKKTNPNCNTKFFKEDGKPNLWYAKNVSGKLEYFTSFGLHPETGETLKKITKHMIRTHICETY